jgi:hypothetical protein
MEDQIKTSLGFGEHRLQNFTWLGFGAQLDCDLKDSSPKRHGSKLCFFQSKIKNSQIRPHPPPPLYYYYYYYYYFFFFFFSSSSTLLPPLGFGRRRGLLSSSFVTPAPTENKEREKRK